LLIGEMLQAYGIAKAGGNTGTAGFTRRPRNFLRPNSFTIFFAHSNAPKRTMDDTPVREIPATIKRKVQSFSLNLT
jgi:hypothetical protein